MKTNVRSPAHHPTDERKRYPTDTKLFLTVFLTLTLLGLAVGLALAYGPDSSGTPLQVAAWPQDFEWLDQAITTTHFIVHYTLISDVTHPDDYLNSHNQAQAISDILEEVYDIYVIDPNYGFREPYGTGTVADPDPLDVYIVDLDTGCGVAMWNTPEPYDYFKLDAACIRGGYDPADLRGVQGTPLHELFHRVQYSYDKGPEEKWSFEGSATTMQDKVYGGPDSLDDQAGSSYVRRCNRYLGSPNRVDYDDYGGSIAGLREASYYGGLFWTYFMQTCGAVNAEPELGMDALRIYWEQTLLFDNVDCMDHAVQASPACPDLHSMEDLFHEFIVANYVKLLGNVSDRYQYADEHGPQGTEYDDVYIEYGREIVRPASPMTHNNEQVAAWGASYYVGQPSADCDWLQVELDGDDGDYLLYAILAVDGGDAHYYDWPRFRRRGDDLTRTFYSDGLDEVVAIVGAPDASARYDVDMHCVDPELEILQPRTDPHYAFVGDPDHPRRFLLRLSVTSDGDYVQGLDESAFSVQVEGAAEDADIISADYVQNQYWLVVQAPIQGAPDFYDLDVTLVDSGLTATEPDALLYLTDRHYDEIIVLDRSGSMDDPPGPPFKIDAAIQAALLYVDEVADGDQLGVLSFASTPTDPPDHRLDLVDDPARDAAKGVIRVLTAGGGTSIGAALLAALDEFTTQGDADKPDIMILLSDGMETVGPYYDEVSGTVRASGVTIHTVALGPDTDQALMQQIHADVGGDYIYATIEDTVFSLAPTVPPAGGRLPATAQPSARAAIPNQVSDWVLGLSDIYDYLEGRVDGQARVHREQLSAGLWDPTTATVPLDVSISYATFAVVHDTSASDLWREVWLVTPGGTIIDPTSLPPGAVYRIDKYHNVYEIPFPEPGVWRVVVEYTPSITPPPGPYNFVVVVRGESSTALELYVGAPIDARLTGSTIPLLVAFLGPDGLLPGATMVASVVHDSTIYPLTLRDDGQHGDGEADDGIYGAFFTRATVEGSFTLQVEGQQGDIARGAMASFFVEADADSDGDGMPDGWENRYGLDPTQDDAGEDPDWDYLPNEVEYLLGTNPLDDDTDGGGEADDAESYAGRDPVNNPDDDVMDRPTGFRGVPGDGQVVIRYDRRASYAELYLYWSTDPEMSDGLANEIAIGTSGIYSHTGLINDTTYYYRLVARNAAGHYSAYTDKIAVTPKADPHPPVGTVVINGGAPIAFSLDAVLTIEAADDSPDDDGVCVPSADPPAEMRVSNDPFLTGASWEPYAETRLWQLLGSPGELTYVYVQFRDAAGNTSGIAEDGIRLAYRIYLPLVLRDQG